LKKLCLILISFITVLFSCEEKNYQPTAEIQQIREAFDSISDVNKRILLESTPYQTPVYIFESQQPGPSVLILGGTHGDEPAGYEAAFRLLDQFYKHPLERGKIILIPEANRHAVQQFNRRVPVPGETDIEKGNLNRCYPGRTDGFPMEQMAYHIQTLAIENRVEVFIDLHEARKPHLATDPEGEDRGLGQTIIYYPNEPSTLLLISVLDGINFPLEDSHAQFSSLERPIKNSAAWWAGESLNCAAFTFETSRSFPLEQRVDFHLKLVGIVLSDLQMH
jgi:succinylglutamate desuccinylase